MEINGKEYSQWLYDEIKKGEHTPLSNSTVIYYFKECAKNKDMGTAQFYISAAYLVEELTTADQREEELLNKLDVYESPWLEVDYIQAESGKGCFDGSLWFVEARLNNKIIITSAKWNKARGWWSEGYGGQAILKSQVKRIRPIPAFWIGGV